MGNKQYNKMMAKEESKKKTKKLSQFYILEVPGTIQLKFGMWGTDSGGHLHS